VSSSLAAESSDTLPVLLRGEPGPLAAWLGAWEQRRTAACLTVIVLGSGLFGAAMGLWRDPLQAGYAAIKFPLIILLTVLGNALINGMLAPLLGLDLRFRQSLFAVLSSFTIAAAILGAFSPVILFFVWNLPPLVETTRSTMLAYSALNLSVVAVIALAGIAANVQLRRLLLHLAGDPRVANRLVFAWLGINLLLGSQLTYILRPFIGSPEFPVQFLRPDAFHGSFYETVFRLLARLFLGAD
jgi:hypothetical protein